MEINRIILEVLVQVPDGLPARKISRHVYNAMNTFFDTYDYDEIHIRVLSTLQKWSREKTSYVEKGDKKGYYRIRKERQNSAQLMLHFKDEPEEPEPETSQDTGELLLF